MPAIRAPAVVGRRLLPAPNKSSSAASGFLADHWPASAGCYRYRRRLRRHRWLQHLRPASSLDFEFICPRGPYRCPEHSRKAVIRLKAIAIAASAVPIGECSIATMNCALLSPAAGSAPRSLTTRSFRSTWFMLF